MASTLDETLNRVRRLLREKYDEHGRDAIIANASISPETLNVLMSGVLPWSSSKYDAEANSRQLRAWTRSISRLAKSFGAKPEKWVDAFQIPMTDRVKDLLNELKAERESLSRHETDERFAVIPQIDYLGMRQGKSAREVSVGLLTYPTFSQEKDEQSFFALLADRLIGTLSPNLKSKPFWHSEIEHFISSLTSSKPSYNLVLGLFDTLPRRRLGIDFVPLPGWNIRLSAVYLSNRNAGGGFDNFLS